MRRRLGLLASHQGNTGHDQPADWVLVPNRAPAHALQGAGPSPVTFDRYRIRTQMYVTAMCEQKQTRTAFVIHLQFFIRCFTMRAGVSNLLLHHIAYQSTKHKRQVRT